MARVEFEVCLRQKNQLTLPDEIVDRLGVKRGDRLIFAFDDKQPEQVRVRRVRRSYAGALAGIYGTPEEVKDYLRGERESWSE